MADIKTRDFSAASAVSILAPQLRKALAQVGTGFDAARRAAIDEVSPELWDEWREEARQIKIHALDHLDYYLDLLEQNVAKAGGHVHFAKDAAQANEIMGELVRTRNIKGSNSLSLGSLRRVKRSKGLRFLREINENRRVHN